MATLRGGGGIKVLKMYYVVCDWSPTNTEPTTTTTELTTTPIETTELATDPTLNIDPGLLEELKKQNMSIPDEE